MRDPLLDLYDRAPKLLDEPEAIAPDPSEIWRRAVGSTTAGPAQRRRARLPLVMVLSSAGATAAVVAIALSPAGSGQHDLPGPSAAVAAVKRTARAAAAATYLPIPDGSYGYLRQRMQAPNGTTEVEYWYGPDGGRVRSRQPDGKVTAAALPAVDPLGLPPVGLQFGGNALLDAADMSTLPTRPDALARALDEHADHPSAGAVPPGAPAGAGHALQRAKQKRPAWMRSAPTASIRWGMIVQILYQERTTPALRAAAIELAASLPGIRINRSTRDPIGRPALRIAHRSALPGTADGNPERADALYLDPDTSATLAVQALVGDAVEATIVALSRDIVHGDSRRPAPATAGRR